MHLSMLSPRVGGGGATPGKLSFPLGRDFDTWSQQGREFDVATILEDRENLEMSHVLSC